MERREKKENIYRIIMLVFLTIVITALITALIAYESLGGNQTKYIVNTGDSSSIGRTFQNLKNFIEKKYIGEIDEEKMLDYAIKGYVAGLEDDYSEYISKSEMEEYIQNTIGEYVGIGVYIGNDTVNNQIIIVGVMKESPAEKAGLKAGDIIQKVDDIEYKGEQLSEASEKLKGIEGTKTKITILRNNQTLDIEVTREKVKTSHIETEVLENNIGYIQINSFNKGSYDEFKSKYDLLSKQNIKSLIIDLRNNGGGIVEEAVNIADLMIEKDSTILITKNKSGEELTKAKQDRKITLPVTILINENTASASEILAGALKDCDSATIIGTKSYGKGVIQTIYTLSDGSGLKLTTDEYFTPNHNAINKIGITPDIEVNLPKNESVYEVDRNNDTQLQKAIEHCKSQM